MQISAWGTSSTPNVSRDCPHKGVIEVLGIRDKTVFRQKLRKKRTVAVRDNLDNAHLSAGKLLLVWIGAVQINTYPEIVNFRFFFVVEIERILYWELCLV